MRGSVARAHTLQSLTANEATRVAQAETLAERRDDSLEHLVFKLAEFLSELLRAHCCTDRDAEGIVYAKIEEWSQAAQSDHCFGEAELLVHKKMYDVLTRDKQGRPKEYQFADWCRRVAACSAATEHATHDTFYKRLAENIYTHVLTPQQKKDPNNQIRTDKSVSQPMRGKINAILRTNLGDSKVSFYICQNGLPRLLQTPTNNHDPSSKLLQSILEEGMTWYAGLLQYILIRQKDPNAIIARKLSDLNQQEWQNHRRAQKAEFRERQMQGEQLARLRDQRTLDYNEMTAAQQKTLEDFDCNRTGRALKKLRIEKPKHF